MAFVGLGNCDNLQQDGIEMGLNQAETVSLELTNLISSMRFHFTTSKSDLK